MHRENEYRMPEEFILPVEYSLVSEPGAERDLEFGGGSTASPYEEEHRSLIRRMMKFTLSAAVILLIYPMMSINLFEPLGGGGGAVVILPTEEETESGEGGGEEETKPNTPGEESSETASESETPEADTTEEAGDLITQTLTVAGVPEITYVNADGTIRAQTDISYEITFRSKKKLDLSAADFDGQDNALDLAVEWLKAQGVDVKGPELVDTEYSYYGLEQSDDCIFIGDTDDLENAYIPQGYVTKKSGRTEKYQTF